MSGNLVIAYQIAGVFRQDYVALVKASLNNRDEGRDYRKVPQPNPQTYPFCGFISWNEDKPTPLVGRMFDVFGESTLSDIEIKNDVLLFTKTYWHGDPSVYGIKYVFQQIGDIWFGTYSSKQMGTNETQCLLTKFNVGIFKF